MHHDLPDRAGSREAHERPRHSPVFALPRPAPDGDVPTDAHRARADIDDVRVPLRDRHRADRTRSEGVVGRRPPVIAGVVGMPNASARCAMDIRVQIIREARDSGDASPAERSDHAVAHPLVQGRIDAR